MTTTVPRLFLTPPEAAQACGVSRDTIMRAIHSGELRAKRTGKVGGKFLIKVSALEDWHDGLEDA
jgi:excisionase family DNA binding protein